MEAIVSGGVSQLLLLQNHTMGRCCNFKKTGITAPKRIQDNLGTQSRQEPDMNGREVPFKNHPSSIRQTWGWGQELYIPAKFTYQGPYWASHFNILGPQALHLSNRDENARENMNSGYGKEFHLQGLTVEEGQ